MEIAAKQTISQRNIETGKSIGLAEKFTAYCHSLEEYRVFLLALTLIIQVCLMVPATLLVTSFIDIGLSGVSIAVMAAGTVAVLVSNMSEMSMKVILTAFIISTSSSLILLAIHVLSIL